MLLAFVPPLIALRFGAIPAVVGGVIAVAVYLVGAQLAFDAGVILAMVPPLVAAVVAIALTGVLASPSRIPLGGLLERLGPKRANARSRRIQAGLLLSSAIFIVVVTLGLQATDALQRMELSSVNKRFDVRGNRAAPSDIALVGIDEETFTQPPKPQWPFPRTDHAKVIRNLLKAGAKVIAYDVQFTEQGPNEKADQALVDAVDGGQGRVVMATTEVREDGTTEIFGGGELLTDSKAVPSFSNYPNDPDGRVRHLEADKNGLVGFDIAAARLFSGREITRAQALLLDRLRRAAGDGGRAELRRRQEQPVRPGSRARQDRRRRCDRARAAGPASAPRPATAR